MIKIRVDDFPQTKGEKQHTLDAFKNFHSVLSDGIGKRNYLLGVIPERCTSDELDYLRTINITPGMHGTDHNEARLDKNGGNQFENFLTEKQVRQQLDKSRASLETALFRPVCFYMPPRNIIDRKSLRAARDAGFSCVTTGPETSLRKEDFDELGVEMFHSEPPHEYGRSDELLMHETDVYLSKYAKRIDMILTLHWTWETNIGLDHLKLFLSQIPKNLFGDF